MKTGGKVALGAGLAVALAVVCWKPLGLFLILTFHKDHKPDAVAQVDGDVAAFAQRVIESSAGPEGPSDAQLARIGWRIAREGDADTLRSLTVEVVEGYSTVFGGSDYVECRRVTFHDLGTPAAGYDGSQVVDCATARPSYYPEPTPSR